MRCPKCGSKNVGWYIRNQVWECFNYGCSIYWTTWQQKAIGEAATILPYLVELALYYEEIPKISDTRKKAKTWLKAHSQQDQ